MPKRFTATEKWDKEWFQSLKPKHKCLWQYLCDKCDSAGFWDVNYGLASAFIGEKITEKDTVFLGDHLLKISPKKFFIVDFIQFQYGQLSQLSKPHVAVMKILERNGIEVVNGFVQIKEYPKGIHTLKDKDKEKELEKEQEQELEKDGVVVEKIVMPYDTDRFREKWAVWLDYRKEIKKPYKSDKSEQAALKELSEFDEDFAIELIDRSMAGGYQGLVFNNTKSDYQKRNATSKNKSGNSAAHSLEEFGASIKEFNAGLRGTG